jgi:TonB family protein
VPEVRRQHRIFHGRAPRAARLVWIALRSVPLFLPALFAGPALAQPAEPAVPDAVVPALPPSEAPAEASGATESTSSDSKDSADVTGVPAEISPPQLPPTAFPYPAGASGPGRVLLELVIEKDGTLRSASVASGVEPFASAALETVRSVHFEPARRAGQPVVARIFLEIRYTPPMDAPLEPAEPRSAGPGPAPVEPVSVQVLGVAEPGALGLSSSDVRILPGAFGDPFRAVSVLPGIAPLVTGLPVFYVRGSPPGNLGFFIDGIRVPLLFHAFLGPAVVHPRLLERTTLYAGGYPARLGRFAGGIVSADLSQPRGEFNGEWSARLIDAGLYLDVPFAEGRGNLIAAGRYSFTALLISLLSDARLDYWDYQVLASYDLTPRDRLSIFSFGAYDFVGSRRTPEPNQQTTVGDGDSAVLFHRLDLRYDHRYSQATRLRVAGTLGVDTTRGAQGRVRDRMAALRLELESRLGPRALLRAGASAGADAYDLKLDPNTEHFLDVVELFPGRTDSVAGGYADLVLDVARGVTVTPGLRLDRYASKGNTAFGISPRLSASFRIRDDLTIEQQIGIADQPPSFVPGVPGVAVAGLPGGLQRSLQTSAGVRAELPASIQARATVFQNAYFDLSDPIGQTQDLDLDADEAKIRSLGHAYGLELLMQRPLSGRWGGMLSYTLSRSTRAHDRVETLSGYDRTHVLNLAASYDLGRHFLVGAQGVFYSGVPGSRTLGEYRVFDRSRAPPFVRADVRLEKRFLLDSGKWWAITAEVMNATLSREVLRRPCSRTCKNDYVGPIVLPLVGMSGQF